MFFPHLQEVGGPEVHDDNQQVVAVDDADVDGRKLSNQDADRLDNFFTPKGSAQRRVSYSIRQAMPEDSMAPEENGLRKLSRDSRVLAEADSSGTGNADKTPFTDPSQRQSIVDMKGKRQGMHEKSGQSVLVLKTIFCNGPPIHHIHQTVVISIPLSLALSLSPYSNRHDSVLTTIMDTKAEINYLESQTMKCRINCPGEIF